MQSGSAGWRATTLTPAPEGRRHDGSCVRARAPVRAPRAYWDYELIEEGKRYRESPTEEEVDQWLRTHPFDNADIDGTRNLIN